MAGKSTVVDRGWNALMRSARGKQAVTAGVGYKSKREAEEALLREFGSASGTQREQPVLRAGFDGHVGDWAALAGRLALRIYAGQLTVEEAARRLAEVAADDVRSSAGNAGAGITGDLVGGG